MGLNKTLRQYNRGRRIAPSKMLRLLLVLQLISLAVPQDLPEGVKPYFYYLPGVKKSDGSQSYFYSLPGIKETNGPKNKPYYFYLPGMEDCPLEDAAGAAVEPLEPLEGEGAAGVVKARRKRSAACRWAQAGLNAHNAKPERRGYSLVLDKTNELGCVTYARQLAQRDSGLQHSCSNCNQYGENLAWNSPMERNDGNGWYKVPAEKPTAQSVVDDWYNEKSPGDQFYPAAGPNHYTQVVWKGSRKLCMATAQSRSGAWFTVARYDPPGNYEGKEAEMLDKD